MSTMFSEGAAAAYIGGADAPVSPRTLQRWRQEGVGPAFVKLGRAVRYRREDLDSFLANRTVTSTSALPAAMTEHD